jgi:predicted RNA binding protein YcfA (HicA-like mRNA interferase family)
MIRINRQRGSHMILTKLGIAVNLSIPDHRELDRGLLRGLIRDAGMSVEEFLKLHR